jgi:hypothetical protein
VPALPPTHVGLIGPFHDSERVRKAARVRAASRTSIDEPRRVVLHRPEVRKPGPKPPLSRVGAVPVSSRQTATSTPVDSGVEGGVSPAKRPLFLHETGLEQRVVRPPRRCYARRSRRSSTRSTAGGWSPQSS